MLNTSILNKMDYIQIPSPCFVLEEEKLHNNLKLIKSVKEKAGVEIILAFKAFAMWSSFPIIREYITYSTASSLAEARLAVEEMGNKAHTYGPAYSDEEFTEIMSCSSHITFNSLGQFHKFYPQTIGNNISCGVRINPEFSDVETDLYNPCAPGSRLGVVSELLANKLPEGIEGLHFHTLCESSSYDLEKTLKVVEEKFGHLFPQIKWINMGGGHLMTREGYDVEHLIQILTHFRARYPHLHVILEPGSAFAWRTGVLVSTVLDVVENRGIKTAMLDVSFSCHMPDCLEMPYKPTIIGCTDIVDESKHTYRMGGNSCLSGDFYGDWSFDKELKIGDRIVFDDMIHYTMVKTTMFNGVSHPSIGIWTSENKFKLVKKFEYSDYKNRMS
jgi:carboxynorspermidine decarboxylase